VRAWRAGAAAGVVVLAVVGMNATIVARATTRAPSSVHVALGRVAGGFSAPTGVTSARDGSGRLFVVEQRGTVRVVRAGTVASRFYLDIRNEVRSGGEQGLLSIAFHPGFARHPYVFAAYTRSSDGALVVSRFRASSHTAANVAASTEVRVVVVPHPGQVNHNGGQLMFGRSGLMFIGTGDGGSEGDPFGNAENLKSLLGKLLRIDVDHSCGRKHYCIPSGNPYARSSTARHEIFAFGLRNPWRMSVDRSDATLWIGDVGQDRYEEIDHTAALGGKDFGWSCMEGRTTYNSSNCSGRHMTPPVFVFSHADGSCAVIGGYAYHGPRYPFAAGLYVFSDFCSAHLWATGRSSSGGYPTARVGQVSGHVTGFGEGDAGEIYVVTQEGRLGHVVFSRA
jgi:glucose/arabinose dehydrogenase